MALDGPEPPARSQAILAFLENERGHERAQGRRLRRPPRRRFRAALDLDGFVTPASVNLGDTLEREGRLDEAVRTWEGLVETTPERAHLVLERLRRVYQARGDAGPLPGPVPAPGRGAAAELAGPPGAGPARWPTAGRSRRPSTSCSRRSATTRTA